MKFKRIIIKESRLFGHEKQEIKKKNENRGYLTFFAIKNNGILKVQKMKN